jgi:hypothetical protein
LSVNDKGELPISVQAAGDNADKMRFAVVWVKQQDPVDRQ